MPRIKLTAGRIRDLCLSENAAQSFFWDTEAPGLAVRVTAGGKAFIFQAKLKNKAIRITIGDVRAWAIESDDAATPGARQEARRLQTLIDQGVDPRQHKADRIAAAVVRRDAARQREVTVADVWAEYIKARRHKWSARHFTDHENMARTGGEKRKRGKGETTAGPLASLLPLRLVDITADQVRVWLADESARRPAQARLAFGALRAFLNWCSDSPAYRELAHPDACATRVGRQVLPKRRAKTDCLQREQLAAWFAAVRALDNPVIAAYLQALLLTGARREELAALTWANLDLRWQSMTIRDKVEGERTIPLTPFVGVLLKDLPRRNQWVFSSPAAMSGRLQEPRLAHNRATTVAGIDGLTLHGLRRSFGTLAEWVECPAGVVAQIMGHKPSATAEKHYRQRPLDLLRMWHSKIEVWVLEQAGIQFDADKSQPLRLVNGRSA